MSGQQDAGTIGASAAEVLAALRECSRFGMVEATVSAWRNGDSLPYATPPMVTTALRLHTALVSLDAAIAGVEPIERSPSDYPPVRDRAAALFGPLVPSYEQIRAYLLGSQWSVIGHYGVRELWRQREGTEAVWLTPVSPNPLWRAEATVAAEAIARVQDRNLSDVAFKLQSQAVEARR